MTMRQFSSLAPVFGVFTASLLACAASAQTQAIEVPLDQVRIVTFASPVKTVFVGNPVVADITVIDPTHVFLMGKSFGTTNLIALDGKGHETLNEQVSVVERSGATVTLHRGAARTTLDCNAYPCQTAPTPGDDRVPYDSVMGQIDKRESTALKAASGQ